MENYIGQPIFDQMQRIIPSCLLKKPSFLMFIKKAKQRHVHLPDHVSFYTVLRSEDDPGSEPEKEFE